MQPVWKFIISGNIFETKHGTMLVPRWSWCDFMYVCIWGMGGGGGGGALQCKLLNLRAIKFSPVNEMHIL